MPLDIHPEYSSHEGSKPRLIFPVLFWIGIIVAAIVIPLQFGCAQTTFQGMCALKGLGQDEHGNTIVLAYCEAQQ